MKRSTRVVLALVLVTLIPAIVALQMSIDPDRKQFQPGKKGAGAMMTKMGDNPVMLPSQFMAGALVGFREVVAGMLWVRCDEFFHNGNYEAIIPLVRIITWLDPHNIDVFCTGAWHLGYNFTDSSNRADKRYLPCAIALLEEGVESNPGVYDLEFDLGFVLYQLKAEDFEKSIYWIKRASEEEDTSFHVSRALAHAYEKAGKLDECERQWKRCIEDAEKAMEKNPKDFGALTHREVSRRNLEGLIIRRIKRADLAKNPADVGFEVEFKRISPRVFEVKGKANLPDGARVNVILSDEDYTPVTKKEFDWEVDPNITILAELSTHGIMLQKGEFYRKYDLSKDAKQYPFAKDRYVLKLIINPRTSGIDVQDRIGWNGEGMTDRKYLDTSIPGVRRIVKTYELKKSDIL